MTLILMELWLLWQRKEKSSPLKPQFPRAYIFGIEHHLEGLYQSWSNNFSGVKNGPPRGGGGGGGGG